MTAKKARGIAGAITAIMTGVAYRTSAEMAGVLGAFPRYEENKESMLRVMRNHRLAAYDADEYEGLEIKPQGLKAEYCPDYLLTAATRAWDEAVQLGEKYGYRNAQATVIAPTGTIGLVMDCDTTGVEPDFALVKFKKLSGGGYFKIINQSVPTALKHLNYTDRQIDTIVKYAVGSATFAGAPAINHQSLSEKGFIAEEIKNWMPPSARPSRSALYSTSIPSEKNACNAWVSNPHSTTISNGACWKRSASPTRRSKPPTTTSAER
jgi:ribonucleoside-diphosphate reductase alpha chain